MGFAKLSFSLLAATSFLSSLSNAAPTGQMSALKRDDTLKFSFGNEKIHGVNLGGWLVLEPWITPSIFESTPDNVVDEYTMGETLGKDAMRSKLESHWSSWITPEDFAEMAGYGINFVRIPIGYWSVSPVDGDPYAQGAYKYLQAALDAANDNGIKVMLDLHGAPRSQNGFDNSGQRGDVGWTLGNSIDQTHTALNKLRDDHAAHPAVAAIELVNEPLGPNLDMNTVRQFYMDGWGDLKNSHVAITFHDAFEGVTSWNDWGSGMWSLMLDTHHYEVFDSGSLQLGIDDHVGTACGFGDQMASNNKWTIAGEWSGAMTDCAKWLNGRGVGARYDGTYDYNGQGSYQIGSCDGKFQGKVADLSAADHDNIQRFVSAQMSAFDKADGWIFWTWKTESSPEWDFQDLARNNMVPQPLSSAGGC